MPTIDDQGRRYEVVQTPTGHVSVYEVERSIEIMLTAQGARLLIVALLDLLDEAEGHAAAT